MSWKVFEECFDKDEHWNSTRCCLWLNFISHLWGAHQGTAFRYEFSFKMFIVLLCIFLSVDSLLAINVSHKCLNQTNQWTSPIFVFIINIFATNQMNGKHMSGCQNSPSFLLTWRRLKEIKSCTILAEKMESIPIVPVCNKRLPNKYFLTFPNFKMKIFTIHTKTFKLSICNFNSICYVITVDQLNNWNLIINLPFCNYVNFVIFICNSNCWFFSWVFDLFLWVY